MKKKLRKKLKKKRKNIQQKVKAQKRQVPQQQTSQQQTSQQSAFAAGLSPEIRRQFDLFISNAISVIHDPQVSQRIIQKLKTTSDPVETVATTTLDIVERLKASAKNNGVNLNLAVIAQGGNIIMNEILTLAKTAGMPPLDDKEKYKAFSLAVALYLSKAVKDGDVTPQELQQWTEDAKKTKQGQKILQGIQEVAAKQPEGASPAPGQANPLEILQGNQPQQPAPGASPPGLLQNKGGI